MTVLAKIIFFKVEGSEFNNGLNGLAELKSELCFWDLNAD